MTQTDKQAHTPGPWALSENYTTAFVQTATNPARRIAEVVDWPHDDRNAAVNARHIVAAVNACEGISTEALEAGVIAEMLEALVFANTDNVDLYLAVAKIKAVIAKAKGAAV